MRFFRGSKAILAVRAAGLGLVLAGHGNGLAQNQNPEVQVRPSTGTASTGNRIAIDVSVTDKLGHAVEGLQAGDFTVLDNREPQKLLDFRAIGARSATDPTQVVVVVDMINTGFNEVAWERQQLDAFLEQDGGKLANPTSLAILADGGIKAQRGWSLDGSALLAAFDKSQTALRSIGREAGFYGDVERMQMSLSQLEQLISYEATQPGRKLFLVISPGWPLLPDAGSQEGIKQREWVFHSIVELTTKLRAGHIILYCLDPFNLGVTNPFYYQSYLKPVAVLKNAEYPDLALQVLAEHSGGQVLIKGKDITGDLNIAVRDASGGYELTFEGSPGDQPNEYHALQVQVDKPEVKVRTTAGYYAKPDLEKAH